MEIMMSAMNGRSVYYEKMRMHGVTLLMTEIALQPGCTNHHYQSTMKTLANSSPLPISTIFGPFYDCRHDRHLQLKDRARRVCSFNMNELLAYNSALDDPMDDDDQLKAMCFRSTFAGAFLVNGVGFPEGYHITALDVVNGQKLGWALGSMLYEINALPWEIEKRYLHQLFTMDLMGSGFVDQKRLVLVELVTVVSIGVVLMLMLVSRRNIAKIFRRRKTSTQVDAAPIPSICAHRQLDYGTNHLS
jgi:GDA1/CD39 (nucleoside phosphatase) family